MANIARLPSGSQSLAQSSGPSSGAYGPHCFTHVDPSRASLYENPAGGNGAKLLAMMNRDGTYTVELTALSSTTMPYANRFLLSTGDVLLKDWRTGNYRVKSSTRRARKAAALQTPVVATPKPIAQPKVEVTKLVQPTAATITVTESDPEPTAPVVNNPIPGMVYPKGKAKLKGAGRGWTDVDGIVVPTPDFEALNAAWSLRQKGKPAGVIVKGPAGTAKTLLVRSFAAYLGVPFLKVDCSAVRTADDWSGSFRQDPNTKTWAHKWSPFALALRAGQPCVILLDDLTRTESPAALNALIGLLDETGTLLVPDANAVLTLPKGIMVVATANIGPEFVGTLPLDGAILQRFTYGVRMGYPTEAIEAKLLVGRSGISRETADALVRLAVQQREHRDDAQSYPSGNVISTRTILGIAEAMSENVEHRTAIWSVLKGQFELADEAALSVLVDTQFPKQVVPSAPPQSGGNPAVFITERHYFNGPVGNANCPYVFSDGTVCGQTDTDPIHL